MHLWPSSRSDHQKLGQDLLLPQSLFLGVVGFFGLVFFLVVVVVVVFSFSIPLKISMFFAEITRASCVPMGGASTGFAMNFSDKPGCAVLSTQRNGDLGVGPAA